MRNHLEDQGLPLDQVKEKRRDLVLTRNCFLNILNFFYRR